MDWIARRCRNQFQHSEPAEQLSCPRLRNRCSIAERIVARWLAFSNRAFLTRSAMSSIAWRASSASALRTVEERRAFRLRGRRAPKPSRLWAARGTGRHPSVEAGVPNLLMDSTLEAPGSSRPGTGHHRQSTFRLMDNFSRASRQAKGGTVRQTCGPRSAIPIEIDGSGAGPARPEKGPPASAFCRSASWCRFLGDRPCRCTSAADWQAASELTEPRRRSGTIDRTWTSTSSHVRPQVPPSIPFTLFQRFVRPQAASPHAATDAQATRVSTGTRSISSSRSRVLAMS